MVIPLLLVVVFNVEFVTLEARCNAVCCSHDPLQESVWPVVGAGGIGFELMGSLRIMQYQEVSAILLVILLMVTLVDTFSSTLRKRFK